MGENPWLLGLNIPMLFQIEAFVDTQDPLGGPMFKAVDFDWNNLITRPDPFGCKDHTVQFYESEVFLSESVCHFITKGLALGEAVIIIATGDHHHAFKMELAKQGCQFTLPVNSGQLIFLDAHEVLSRITIGGVPNPLLFQAVVGRLIGKTLESFTRIRAYGEMVDILRTDGNLKGMIQLEQQWNELSKSRSFSLLCGYQMEGFSENGHSNAFQAVCEAHSHILPSESYIGLTQSGEQLRRVAYLQRQANSFQCELKRRYEVEEALRQAEAFKSLIIESSRDCIKVLDLSAKLLFINKWGMETLEISDFGLIQGSYWIDCWMDEDKVAAKQAFSAVVGGRAAEFTGYFPTTQTKIPKWWHVVLSPILDSEGNVWRVLAVSRDITEQKLMENELRQAIAARDEFLSIASHELKTPITSLKLQAQLQQRRFDRNDASLVTRKSVGKLLDTTNRSVDRLSRLVDDMLDISRITHGKLHLEFEEIDLSFLVREVVDRFDEALRNAGCRYRVITDCAVTGKWDRYRLEQVITNLITNVMKYSAGKPVEISVTSDDSASAVISVRDEGDGISKENLERVFQRFERAVSPSTISGLGLGLYISRQIVTAHKGKIWAESELGKGATFFVRLPRLV